MVGLQIFLMKVDMMITRKVWWLTAVALLFCVRDVFGRTVSGNNQFVSVSLTDNYSWQQICGLKSVVPLSSSHDIHVTTENPYETGYRATLTVTAQPGWQLIAPTGPVQTWQGNITTYIVKKRGGREVYESGRIILFQVDVTLRNIGEEAEEVNGGLLTGFIRCTEHCAETDYPLIPVSISCTPQYEPGDIRLSVTGGNLLVKNGDEYVPAAATYQANHLRMTRFWLLPTSASAYYGNWQVKAEHLVNDCMDIARYTTPDFDFTITSDNVPSAVYVPSGMLVDNHAATVRITPPNFVNTAGLRYYLSSQPIERSNIVNKYGTDITFTPTANNLIFQTSKIYWYGVLPDAECHRYTYSYHFSLSVLGMDTPIYCNRHYFVYIPNDGSELSGHILDPYTGLVNDNGARSYSYVTTPISTGDTNHPFRCEIIFSDFQKFYSVYVSAIHQYKEEVEREEQYHKKQWMGEVSSDNGGQADCYTGTGIKYFMETYRNIPCVPCYIYGNTASDAYEGAFALLLECEAIERDVSNLITKLDTGFIEFKAKQHVGYNAAFRYHCTYQNKYGSNPQNHVHPAFQ